MTQSWTHIRISQRTTSSRLLLVASLCLSACGLGREAPPMVLELRPSGQTAFMPDSISAKAGSRVALRLINETELAHNVVVILDQGSVEDIVLASYGAIKTQYVPTGFEDAILASTPLVYPGEAFEVSFVMPEPGRYTYVCVFPGHGLAMRGTLISLQ